MWRGPRQLQSDGGPHPDAAGALAIPLRTAKEALAGMQRGPRQSHCEPSPLLDAAKARAAPKRQRPPPYCSGGPNIPTEKELPALMWCGPQRLKSNTSPNA